MEGKRRVILFLLLATLSSVMGLDFTFSRENYEAVLRTETDPSIFLKDTKGIAFVNLGRNEVLYAPKQVLPSGINLSPINPESVEAGISRTKEPGQNPERLYHVTLKFAKVTHSSREIIFGKIRICFQNFEDSPHESCLMAHMFSPPQTPADKKYAEEVAKNVNPLTQEQLRSISDGKPFKWALSSLEKVLSDGIKKITYTSLQNSAFALKPIIVDEKLLKQYYYLAHPKGRGVEYLGNV